MKNILILFAAVLMLSLTLPRFELASFIKYENAGIQLKKVRYQEIKVAEIPEAVRNSIAKNFTAYSMEKIFLADDSTYKVLVSKAEIEDVIFFDNKGLLLDGERNVPE